VTKYLPHKQTRKNEYANQLYSVLPSNNEYISPDMVNEFLEVLNIEIFSSLAFFVTSGLIGTLLVNTMAEISLINATARLFL